MQRLPFTKSFRIIVIATLAIIVFLLLAGIIWLRHTSRQGIPDYNADVFLSGLSDTVEVYRDVHGIPHVYAQNELDLYRVLGYLMAQDRLWQMDLLRRVSLGRLSEIFGEEMVDADQLFRALRIKENSKQVMCNTDPHIIRCADAYTDGINQYITQNTGNLPFEFSVLGYEPEPWETSHSFNLIGYMAFDQSMGWSTESLIYKISLMVGDEKLSELIPDLEIQDAVFPEFMLDMDVEINMDLLSAIHSVRKLGIQLMNGSNNWVVDGKHSSTGKPIVCTDTHEYINFAPGIWYPMHQHVSEQLNVTGMGVPGCPFIIHGHNDSIAWGMTNVMVDDIDLYLETLDPDTTHYFLNGKWRELEIMKEEIGIKGGKVIIRINRFTHRGPIISSFKGIEDRSISMRWLGNEYSNEARALFLLNRANNLDEFKEAVRTFKSNSQNIAYGDVAGNIGMFVIAGIPIRTGNRSLVSPGDTSLYDWKGMLPFELLPWKLNPERGFLASANNRIAGADYPYHISHWYVLPFRYDRICELLSDQQVYSPEDMEGLQADQDSKWVLKILEVILPELDKAKLEGKAANLYKVFRAWDGRMDMDAIEPSLFESFYLELMKSIFLDELGNDLYNELISQVLVPSYVLDRCLEGQDISWCDNITTTSVESFSDLIVPSWIASVEWLSDNYGKKSSGWIWGDLHQISFPHALGSVKLLKKAFRLEKGPFRVGGAMHTVSPYSYNPTLPFNVVHGSALRLIYPVNDWDDSQIIMPTGVSGIPSSDFYCNQTQMYINHKYVNDLFSKDSVVAKTVYQCSFMSNP
jgi:penicillin amidase